ncbi:insulinase family protein [Desulfopila sp. IMCC35006]|uniref:M16 family metallopeptidase n=1 Tax=Desulfopila sp. IMCC35006 TaxID=2569542 RepID=UPI0010AB505B|nr:M16 family metallopeptidase [Desulfopila sp. IMCC35006]TKB27707.1 insulinase family protein [Desulfopila sp. IMCC35006]
MFFLRFKFLSFRKTTAFLALVFALAGFTGTALSSPPDSTSACLSTRWPSEVSQLVPDPSLVRGKLKNGFRYVLKQNQEPAHRVAMYLAVQAGSLNETDNQRGLAHFLEHMMFNGSTHFPPGSLVNYFQSLGMSFGGDTNARTTHDQTVYNIILPSGSEKDLASGLRVMADYARGALLLESEIDRERGVILAEKRARDSAEYRTSVAGSDFAFRGTRYPERMPIGTTKTLEEADHALLKSYYDAWYRPDNMVIVVVGDIDPQRTADLIDKHFSPLTPAGPAPECPAFGKLQQKGVEAFYHYEPELGKTNVSIQSVWDLPLENDSLELEKKELLGLMGSMIVDYRLQRIQEKAKPPFVRAGYYSGDIVNRIGYASLVAQVGGSHWQETVTALDRILRQALVYGFSKDEVERARKEILAQLDARVLTADSEDSRTIANRIIDHLGNNRVYQSATQEKELYGPLTREITPAEVNAAFQERWSHNNRLISVTGDIALGDTGRAEIASLYREVTKEPVIASISEQKQIFPYLQPAPPSGPPQTSYLKDIHVERLVFPDGLVVNLKKTPFEENRVRVKAVFGLGKMKEPVPGVGMFLEDVVNGSGSGSLSQSAMDEVLASSSIQMAFKVDESDFSWTGTALAKDFELYSQVLYHRLVDPGLRENIFTRARKNYEQMYQKISQDIEGAMPLAVQPFLADYNKQFGLPPWSDVAQVNFTSLQKWASPLLRPGDLEISVVGDFDRDKIVAVLTKYFSGLALRPAKVPDLPELQFPAGKKLVVKVNTSVEKSLIVIAWPTDDFWDIHRTRRLHLLASVFGDRLREVIREKLAASYSPNVASFSSRDFQGYGYIISQVLVKPGTENAIVAEICRISEQLQKEGITNDELTRAKGPLLTSLQENIRTNQYWLNSVLALSVRYPQQLVWPDTIISDFSSISVADVNELAARYLHNDRAAIARVTPEDVDVRKGKGNLAFSKK